MNSINSLSLIGFLFLIFSCTPHLIEIENQFPILALPADSINSHSFKANWVSSKDVESYFLLISTQEDMQKLVENPRIIKNNEVIISNLNSNTTYYYQVGIAKKFGLESEHYPNNDSDVIKVTTKEIERNRFSLINSFKVNGFKGKIAIPRFNKMSQLIEVSQDEHFNDIPLTVELKKESNGEFQVSKLNPLATYYIRIKEIETVEDKNSNESISTIHYSDTVKVDMHKALLTNVYIDSVLFKTEEDEHLLRFSYNHSTLTPKSVSEEINYHSSNKYVKRLWKFNYTNDSSLLLNVDVNSTDEQGIWGKKKIIYDYSQINSNCITASINKGQVDNSYKLKLHYNKKSLPNRVNVTEIVFVYQNGANFSYLYNNSNCLVNEIERTKSYADNTGHTTFNLDYDIYDDRYSINYSYILPFQILISFEDIILPSSIFPDLEFISQGFKFNPKIINSSNGVELYHYEYNEYGLPIERVAYNSTTYINYSINPNKYNPLKNNGK